MKKKAMTLTPLNKGKETFALTETREAVLPEELVEEVQRERVRRKVKEGQREQRPYKLKDSEKVMIKILAAQGASQTELSEQFGISQPGINYIINKWGKGKSDARNAAIRELWTSTIGALGVIRQIGEVDLDRVGPITTPGGTSRSSGMAPSVGKPDGGPEGSRQIDW